MVYGYARVSTAQQDYSTQIADLIKAGAKKIYKDKYTGTTSNRPEFDKLLTQLKKGDTLIVTTLDRLARNTQDALNIIKDLNDESIILRILNLGTIDNSPTGRLIYTVFAAFAEFERDLIVARTQEGKAWAKANNPNISYEQLNDQTTLYIMDYVGKYGTIQTVKRTLFGRIIGVGRR